LAKNTLVDIKQGLDSYVGQKIRLTANGGRKKTTVKTGILEETYPSVFVVNLEQERNSFKRVSYSYADVLTSTIELVIVTDDGDVEFRFK